MPCYPGELGRVRVGLSIFGVGQVKNPRLAWLLESSCELVRNTCFWDLSPPDTDLMVLALGLEICSFKRSPGEVDVVTPFRIHCSWDTPFCLCHLYVWLPARLSLALWPRSVLTRYGPSRPHSSGMQLAAARTIPLFSSLQHQAAW